MLALVLKWLSGGVLTSVLGHLERRTELENISESIKADITKEAIRQELETRKEQAGIIKAKLQHRVAWLPMFLAECFAVLYLAAILVDAIWDLPGEVIEVSPAMAVILSTIIGGMFVQRMKS